MEKIVGDDVTSVEIQTSATKQEGNKVYINLINHLLLKMSLILR